MQFGRNVFQRLLIGGINFDSQSLFGGGKWGRAPFWWVFGWIKGYLRTFEPYGF